MTIFLAICFIPILPLLYFMLKNEAKPKNNLILSTTLPKEAWEDSRVQAIVKEFRRSLNIIFLLLTIAIIPPFFIDYFSIVMTYFMVWLILIIVIPYIPYCHSVKKMRTLKKENWYHPEAVNIQIADTKAMAAPLHLKPSFSFVLPFIISLIPMLYPLAVPSDSSYLTLYIISGANSFTIAACYLCYRFLLRRKDDRINDDTTLTITLTRIRRYYWGKFWLALAWFSCLYSFSGLFLQSYALFFIIFSSVLVIALIAMTIRMEFAVRSAQQRFNATEDSVILMDEDDYWPYGAFYYNPKDTSTIVNSRIGFGSTMNMARPASKIITIVAMLLLLSLPFLGIWMVKEEFTPIHLSLTDTSIQAYHLHLEYEIPFDDIIDCYLLTELPRTSRNFGSGMENVYKGNFSVKGIANNCQVCLNPNVDLFLVIQTEERTYLFSMSDVDDSDELREIYETIQAKK